RNRPVRLGASPAWKEPPDEKTEEGHGPDIPQTELGDSIVRHVLPEAISINYRLFEQDPRVKKSEPDCESDYARRSFRFGFLWRHRSSSGSDVIFWSEERLLVQVDLKSRGIEHAYNRASCITGGPASIGDPLLRGAGPSTQDIARGRQAYLPRVHN